jgi:hypothetical protein
LRGIRTHGKPVLPIFADEPYGRPVINRLKFQKMRGSFDGDTEVRSDPAHERDYRLIRTGVLVQRLDMPENGSPFLGRAAVHMHLGVQGVFGREIGDGAERGAAGFAAAVELKPGSCHRFSLGFVAHILAGTGNLGSFQPRLCHVK